MDGIEEHHLDQHLSSSARHVLDSRTAETRAASVGDTAVTPSNRLRATDAKQGQLSLPTTINFSPQKPASGSRNPSSSTAPRRSVRISLSGSGAEVDQTIQDHGANRKKKVQIEESESTGVKRK